MTFLSKLIFGMLAVVLGTACLAWAAEDGKPAILPTPKSIKLDGGAMPLTAESRIVVTDPRLEVHAPVLAQELWLITGERPKIVKDGARAGDIILKINSALQADADILAPRNLAVVYTRDMAHTVSVTDRVVVEGWDFRAVCEGTATVIQSIGGARGQNFIPKMTVKDWPPADFTATMIDCGRQWMPADTLQAVVECCRLWKIRYLQLHLGDDQGYAFPSKALPRLGTSNQDCMNGAGVKRWTWQEMVDLEAFAAARGVAIIPAIETPGHHGAMARCYRDLFDGPGCMDMASEELYEGLDTVIGEMCDVFKSTPYIDVGCDECNWTGVGAGPQATVYKRRHAIPRDAQGVRNASEIYVVHMKRMADIGRKYGKLTIAWEDFPRDSRINKDIIAVLWYPHAVAQDWQREGWTTITAPWQLGVPYHVWNMYHCNGSTMQRTDRVLGVTGTMWQMSRLTVVNAWMNGANSGAERTWGPDTPIDYAEFEKRKAVATARATFLATPVELVASGGLIEGVDHYLSFRTIYGGERTFDLKAPIPGEIRYTSDFTEPTMASPVWAGPVTWKKNFVLNAALFVDGTQIGSVSRHEYKWRDIEGYITNWDVAGPYVIEGKSGKDLYDVAFAPEKNEHVKWLHFKPNPADPIPWIVSFDAFPGFSGDARVAYLRAQVFSPKAQDALIYVGTDDGVKVFINGQFVHGVNAGRGVSEEDRAGIKLHQGWNTVLIKDNNWTGGYAAKARIRSASDGPLEGMKVKTETGGESR